MSREIVHDTENHRFVLDVEGQAAYLAYQWVGEDTVELYSTYVPPALRGRGLGVRVVDAGLAWAQEQGARVLPSCWFVRDVLARRPGLRDLVARP